MKKIIISFLISISFFSCVNAATLVPSLANQIIRQEKINKKNDHVSRLTEQARIRQEAIDRATELRYQRIAKRNINKVTTPQFIVPSNQLAIKHPPEIAPLKINPTPLINTNIPIPPNVDISRVQSTWISWYNGIRRSGWLKPYIYDTRIDKTAYDWNIEFAKGKWQNHHRRNPSDTYYDFPVIDQWFMDLGINPKIINRSKNTENVWYGYYNCTSGDCTDKLISSIRSTFDFYMSEKGKSNDSHYRSIVNPYFTKIGLSIIVVPSEQRYYLTVHYITE